jgi:hypothetical protein
MKEMTNEKLKQIMNDAALVAVLRSSGVSDANMLAWVLKELIKAPMAAEIVTSLKSRLSEAESSNEKLYDKLDDLYSRLSELRTDLSLHGMGYEDNEPEVTVYAYLYDQAYGGPEEGGWWYGTEQPIEGKSFKVRLSKANKVCRRLNELTDLLVNKNRRNPSSVLSEGHFHWKWTLLDEPIAEPRHRPRYE